MDPNDDGYILSMEKYGYSNPWDRLIDSLVVRNKKNIVAAACQHWEILKTYYDQKSHMQRIKFVDENHALAFLLRWAS